MFESTLHGLQMWWWKTLISPNHRPSPLWLAEHLSCNVMPDKLQEFGVCLKITHLKKIHNNVYTQLKGKKLLDNTKSVKRKISAEYLTPVVTTVPRPKQSLSKTIQEVSVYSTLPSPERKKGKYRYEQIEAWFVRQRRTGSGCRSSVDWPPWSPRTICMTICNNCDLSRSHFEVWNWMRCGHATSFIIGCYSWLPVVCLANILV